MDDGDGDQDKVEGEEEEDELGAVSHARTNKTQERHTKI